MNILLHHSCVRITPNSLETVAKIFKKLDCNITFRPEPQFRWMMLGQGGHDIQIKESQLGRSQSGRIGAHIAFTHISPRTIVDDMKAWAQDRMLDFNWGQWNENEFWFDFPDLFTDWVIEVLTPPAI